MQPWGHLCQLLGKGAGREEAAAVTATLAACCLAPWVNSRLAGLALAPFLLSDWQQLSSKEPEALPTSSPGIFQG